MKRASELVRAAAPSRGGRLLTLFKRLLHFFTCYVVAVEKKR